MAESKTSRSILVIVLASALISANCATLTRKSTQRIPVTSYPAGAMVSINGTALGTTPVELRFRRSQNAPVIRIESPGYNPVEIRVKRKLSGTHLVADAVLGAAIGGLIALRGFFKKDETASLGGIALVSIPVSAGILIAIDVGTSAGFDISPEELIVTLKKAAGPPRVETILLNAKELQNIKWIRVHGD